MKKNSKGFTIVELMMALIVGTILLVIGVPSFMAVVENNQLATEINGLVTALNNARSEAVKRGRRVTVCTSADGATCGGAGYEAGWIVFEEDNTSANHGTYQAATETLLAVGNALDSGYTLRGTTGMFNSYISFVSTGQAVGASASGTQGQFVLCKNSDLTKSRALFVLTTGRVRLGRDTDADYVPEDDSGTDITTCTPS